MRGYEFPKTVGGFLLSELWRRGVRHIFGVPGDYTLGLCNLIEESPIRFVGTTREDTAGFAADAYARLNGLGVACVTYGVGGSCLVNTVRGAYVERSPLVIVSGAVGVKNRKAIENAEDPLFRDALFHHYVKSLMGQRAFFSIFTAAAAAIEDAESAPETIRSVLDAAEREKRPVYLELPQDIAAAPVEEDAGANCAPPLPFPSDKTSLTEALEDAAQAINKSSNPVIIAGFEIRRFGLQGFLRRLVEEKEIPFAATISGKSVIEETHPLYGGVYAGAISREEVRHFVESSDCLIMLGAPLNDLELGVFTAKIRGERTIHAIQRRALVFNRRYDDVELNDFLGGLVPLIKKRKVPRVPPVRNARGSPDERPTAPLTVESLFRKIQTIIGQKTLFICDIGDCLFGALDLVTVRPEAFLATPVYASMGTAVPAALGAGFARPDLRPLVLVGDGAFQMTGTELSTIGKYGFNPIVVVLNNLGYTTERFISEGPYNDITDWQYECAPLLLGSGCGFIAASERDFEVALSEAWELREWSLINAILDPHDHSQALKRLGEELAKRIT